MQHLHDTLFRNSNATAPSVGWREGLYCLASLLVLIAAVVILMLIA